VCIQAGIEQSHLALLAEHDVPQLPTAFTTMGDDDIDPPFAPTPFMQPMPPIGGCPHDSQARSRMSSCQLFSST
jgi:hypothetical protein